MHEGEVRAIKNVVQVMVVVVHLRRGELAFVDDVLGRERADVEALGERTLRVRATGCEAT